MANKQIPNLPQAVGLTGAEQLEIVQGGTSARTTVGQIASFANFGEAPLTDNGMQYVYGQDDDDLNRRGKLPYLTPDNYYLGGSDETAALLRCRDKARDLGVPVLISAPIIYKQTYEIQSGDGLIIPSSVGLIVHETQFSGDAAIDAGDETDIAEFWSVSGGGFIECNNVIDVGIRVIKGRFARISDLDLRGGGTSSILIGTSVDTFNSYEVDATNCRAYYNDVANSASSIGFHAQQATDCHFNLTYSIGYRKGVRLDAAANYIDQGHVWTRPVHGPLTHCFDIQGADCVVTRCYADTPTNYGDASITDCYGFYVNGDNCMMDQSSVFMNTTIVPDLSTDGIVSCMYEERETFSSFGDWNIFGGTSGTKRFKRGVKTFGTSSTVGRILQPGSTFFSTSPAGLSTVASASGQNVVHNGIQNYAGVINMQGLQGSTSYANDAAAAAGGIAVGQTYRNGSVVQIRIV